MHSDRLLHTLLALSLVCCASNSEERLNPNLTRDQYVFMKSNNFVDIKSLLLCDNVFHSSLMFFGFAVLTAVRHLPTSLVVLSAVLFLVSLFYKRWTIHASYLLVMSLVMLIGDVVMNLHCLAISILNPSIVPPAVFLNPLDAIPFWSSLQGASASFWSWAATSQIYALVKGFFTGIASWPVCSVVVSYASRTLGALLFFGKSAGLYAFEIVRSNLSDRAFCFFTFYGCLTMLNIFLILACLCMLLQIKRSQSKIFHLKESYHWYAVFVVVRFAVLFHMPLSLGSILRNFGGYVGRHVLTAALYEMLLCILVCWVCHFVLVSLCDKHEKCVTTEK